MLTFVILLVYNIGFDFLCQEVLFGTEFALLGQNPIFYVINHKWNCPYSITEFCENQILR